MKIFRPQRFSSVERGNMYAHTVVSRRCVRVIECTLPSVRFKKCRYEPLAIENQAVVEHRAGQSTPTTAKEGV